MKSFIAIVLVSFVSISSVMADSQKLVCKTTPDKTGGFTQITISSLDENTATLTGFESGGEARFVRPIGPFSVTISEEGDALIYANKTEETDLSVVRTGIEGHLVSTALFTESDEGGAIPMNCRVQE